jgi:protein-S-isoprenylcysteine O-methyltransferase Ste14
MALQSGRQVPAYRMTMLELKVPPPLAAALVAAAMWLLALIAPSVPAPEEARVGAAALAALAGAAFDLAAVLAFRRARTTINPLRPHKSSALVTGGIYRLSRNPMYVGLLLFLVAWAAYLAAPLALLGPLAFIAYMSRFQIRPEERILAAIFGAQYEAYRSRVRRWL